MILKPMDMRIPKPRTIKHTFVGDKIDTFYTTKSGHRVYSHYVVEAVYPFYVRCRDIHNGRKECFNIGDLVMLGKEPSWDPAYGVDPTLTCPFI